ncbi:MAG: FAD-binding oxidoreductase [Candidatus Gottesmanbacteria bacterium]|nr:FAD-binding oxidoreductase [Candidatus Gottesmanbacteria bacterium]
MDKPQMYTAIVNSVTNVAGEFHVAKLKLVDPKEMQFTAGQYVICKIGPPKGNHTLSIASAPSQDGTIELLQSVAPMGEGSKWLLGLKPGDPVQFLGPLGKFVLQKESIRPKVFVATGCGIAPLRGMIMDKLSVVSHQSSESKNSLKAESGELMTLFWGLRYETDVFWKDEFEGLAATHPNFRFVLTLSQPASTQRGEPMDAWTGAQGRVTEHVIGETPDLTNSEFYLCGTRGMIVDMRQLLTDNGVAPSQIFTETFF